MSAGTIALAAGGTGGHVFPAVALAAELMRRGRKLLLVTDARTANYEKLFPGVAIEVVPAATPAGRNFFGKMGAFAELGIGVMAARKALRQHGASAVVGFGGYPSLPATAAGSLLGLPLALHEQNAVLGRVNRLLAGRARSIATSFAHTAHVSRADEAKIVVVGNPIRDAIARLIDQPYAPPLSAGRFEILVLGGSQGATIFSDVVPSAMAALTQVQRLRLRISQQCRPEDLERVRAAYRALNIDAVCESFFDDVPARIARCHLVISRSGASTVAEIAASGRPAILVPYLHATDDHQTANAEAAVAAGAAIRVAQNEFTPAALAGRLAGLMDDPERLLRMAHAAHGMARPNAAKSLADMVERLAPANGNSINSASKGQAA